MFFHEDILDMPSRCFNISEYIQWGSESWMSLFKWSCFQMVGIALVPTIWKLDHSKSGCFCSDIKWFLTKQLPFIRINMVGLRDFRSHSKSEPFKRMSKHSDFKWCLDKSFRISSPHCIGLVHYYLNHRCLGIIILF